MTWVTLREVRRNHYLVCGKQNGDRVKIPSGSPVVQAAKPLFFEKMKRRGIPVIDDTNASSCRG
jgi:hypothetical protein